MKNSTDPLKDPRFDELLSRLRREDGPTPSADFSDRVMERLQYKPISRWLVPSRILRATAAVALLLSAGFWMARQPPPSPLRSPVDILLSAQRSDGGWSADEQNLRPRYDIGVTALALLALIHSDPAALEGPHAAAIRAGLAHLLSQQQPGGRFGEDFSGAAFTQYLAAMALQAAAKFPNADPAWRVAAAQTEPYLPPKTQMAKLNHHLAHPVAFPPRWIDAGGPSTQAAIQLLSSSN